jgi:hypothetical protein
MNPLFTRRNARFLLQCKQSPQFSAGVRQALVMQSTCRIWTVIANWLGLPKTKPVVPPTSTSPLQWWEAISSRPRTPRKAVLSLALLIIWEIWNETNNRAFERTESTVTTPGANLAENFTGVIRVKFSV